ncbi:MAG: type I CRISPR-associated protein Cas7, partial [Caldilineaceae bacterium]|nr:type I CRISPR-associated protein Cas7 [Caldilineaceae bacterium]
DNERTMGRKQIVPYGLYRAEGYVSAKLANAQTKGTGFSDEDLDLLWEALINMFEHDHSAARGKMATRKLIVFKHDSDLGNAPAHQLFDLVKVVRKPEVIVPRSFSDYDVSIDADRAPNGVTIINQL